MIRKSDTEHAAGMTQLFGRAVAIVRNPKLGFVRYILADRAGKPWATLLLDGEVVDQVIEAPVGMEMV